MVSPLLMIAVLFIVQVVGQMPGMTVEQLHKLNRVGGFAVNPQGTQIAYTLRSWDGTTVSNSLLITDAPGFNTKVVKGASSVSNPAWTVKQEALQLSFLSSVSGSNQVHVYNNDTGRIYQLTEYPIDIQGLRWFEGGFIAVMSVYPDCPNLQCTANRDQAVAARGENTWKQYDSLFVRHWDEWETGKVSHIFWQKVWFQSGNFQLIGDPLDLMSGMNVNSPVPPFGGMEQIDIAPGGTELAFTGQTVDRTAAWTTGWDTYIVPLPGNGGQPPVCITPQISARTQNPAYSPDGKYLAYLAMDRPGFEADKLHINLYNRQTQVTTPLTSHMDISFSGIVWGADSQSIYGDADMFGVHPILQVFIASPANPRYLVGQSTNSDITRVGNSLFFLRNSMTRPNDIWSLELQNSIPHQITRVNDNQLTSFNVSIPKRFSFVGSLGDTVYGWVVPPVNYKPGQKYPVVQLVHGGPQGNWGDDWSYRWNPQLWAAHGYFVYMIDFHGSTGYGQAFTDAISGNWGSYPYWDIMNGTEYVLSQYPDMDPNRVAACGASYGGFMINWIQGHTNFFKALVTHDGIFDTTLGYYATEELWFPEWEFKGLPWEVPENYQKWNPAAFINNWQTPHLIIHGQHDYRLPVSHGLGAFTVLQRKNIPSQFLYFTEENHWVLNDANGIKWYHTVLAWLDRFTGNKAE